MQHIHNSAAVVTIQEDASLRQAAEEMSSRGIGSLVVTNESGEVTGILTDRDLCVRAVAVNQDPDESTVRRAMTPDPYTLPHTATHSERVAAMRSLGVRRLPLVDEQDRPINLVSLDDELQWTARQLYRLAETAQAGRRHGPFRSSRPTLEELEERIGQTIKSGLRESNALDGSLEGYHTILREKLMLAIDELRDRIEVSKSSEPSA